MEMISKSLGDALVSGVGSLIDRLGRRNSIIDQLKAVLFALAFIGLFIGIPALADAFIYYFL